MKSLSILFMLLSGAVLADEFAATEEKIKAAMQGEVRTQAEKDRDRNRMPVQTLEFFGLRDDMKVIELLPGGGWYTKILAPVLRDNGELYVAIGTGRVKDSLLGESGFDRVKVIAEDAKVERKPGDRLYSLEMDGLGVKKADMVLTFRNYHNFSESGRRAMNEAVWDALKPGGIYAVVDHTRRHMQGENDENRRRIDPVLAIKEIQDAGFILVDYADLHYRLDDELVYEVGRRSVSGNTDRFTLKFKKVKK